MPRLIALLLLCFFTAHALGGAPVIELNTFTIGGKYRVPADYYVIASDKPFLYAAEGLPKGLYISQTTGAIHGTPEEGGFFALKLYARNEFGLGELTDQLVVVGIGRSLKPTIRVPQDNVALENHTFSIRLSAVGATLITFRALDPIPPNFEVIGNSVQIGTSFVAKPGTFNVTVVGTNGNGDGTPLTFPVVIVPENAPPKIARPGGAAPVLDLQLGDTVNQTIAAAGTGTLTYEYGAFPKGLSGFDRLVSGIALEPGSFAVPVKVSNAFGADQLMLTINVAGSLVPGTLSVKDTYKDTAKKQITIGTSSFSVKATLAGTSEFKFDDAVQVNIGDFVFRRRLDNGSDAVLGDSKFLEGKSASFADQILSPFDSDKYFTVRTVKVANGKKVSVTISAKASDDVTFNENLVLSRYFTAPQGIDIKIPAVVRVGSIASVFELHVTGKTAEKTGNEESFWSGSAAGASK